MTGRGEQPFPPVLKAGGSERRRVNGPSEPRVFRPAGGSLTTDYWFPIFPFSISTG
jgi:hypothetical protein